MSSFGHLLNFRWSFPTCIGFLIIVSGLCWISHEIYRTLLISPFFWRCLVLSFWIRISNEHSRWDQIFLESSSSSIPISAELIIFNLVYSWTPCERCLWLRSFWWMTPTYTSLDLFAFYHFSVGLPIWESNGIWDEQLFLNPIVAREINFISWTPNHGFRAVDWIRISNKHSWLNQIFL